MGEKNKLLHAVMQGRLDFFRSCSVYSPLSAATFQDKGAGSFFYASGMDYAPSNGIIEDEERILSEKEIEVAKQFFEKRKLPFIWWTKATTLEKKGFQFGGILTGIAADISKEAFDQNISSDVEIKIIDGEEDLETFACLSVNAFGMHPGSLKQFQSICSAAMRKKEQIHFLALLEGTPVGTATLSISERSAGIWNLATEAGFRKKGIGSALVQRALIEAKKRHYHQIMAILMPKGMAWGVFTKLGFQEICEFPFYVYGTPAHELEK